MLINRNRYFRRTIREDIHSAVTECEKNLNVHDYIVSKKNTKDLGYCFAWKGGKPEVELKKGVTKREKYAFVSAYIIYVSTIIGFFFSSFLPSKNYRSFVNEEKPLVDSRRVSFQTLNRLIRGHWRISLIPSWFNFIGWSVGFFFSILSHDRSFRSRNIIIIVSN